MHLYVIRHSDPLWEGDGLTDIGYREAEAAAERLKAVGVTHLYSSDLLRATETARITAEAAGISVSVDPWLREPGYLSIEQQGGRYTLWDTFGETVRADLPPPSFDDWTERPPFDDPRVASMWVEFRRNADALLLRHGYRREGERYAIERRSDDRVAVFTHNGTVLLFLAHLLLLPVSLVWCGFYSWPSAVTDFLMEEHSERWAVPRAVCVADVSHLVARGMKAQARGMGNWYESFY